MSWRGSMPRGVLDPYDSQDQPVFTPTDRRLLWHLENALAVAATSDGLRQLAVGLREYLTETCEHHWMHLPADDCCPAMRQCIWCHETTASGQGEPGEAP